MDLSSIIEVFGAVITALGGYEAVKWLVTSIVHRKQEKQLKEAEVEKKETEVDSDEFHLYRERIEELRSANAELNKQNLELIKSGARKDEIILEKTNNIRDLQEQRAEEAMRIGQLEKEVLYFNSWKCYREYGRGGDRCARRKPAQNPPLKYEPIDKDAK